MRARAALIRLGTAAALLAVPWLLGGCGVIFNGTSSRVNVRSTTPNSEILVNGGVAGRDSATFTTSYNAEEQTVVVRAPGYKPRTIVLERKVSVAAVICDALWSLTIIGLAAPISDAILDSFSSLGPSDIQVALEPVGGAAAPVPAPPPPPPPPAPTSGTALLSVPRRPARP